MGPEILGVDIGGSHITAALVNLETGGLVQNSIRRIAIDAQSDKESILSEWSKIITGAFGEQLNATSKIGIAIPGPFDYEKGVSLIKDQDKFKSLYKVDVKVELAKHLKIDSNAIKFINDAASFMQGEIFSGAGKGHREVIGITLGTGLGSSIAANGMVKDAELWDSKFKEGIAEDYLSTRWFIKRYKELTDKEISGVKALVEMVDVDETAKAIFTEFGNNLGGFLCPLIKKTNADIVILGGNIAKAYSFFEKSLVDTLNKECNVEVRISALNEHAALIGAASCWSLETKESENVERTALSD